MRRIGINGAHGPFSLSGTASYLNTDGFQSLNNDYWNFSTVWRSDLDLLPTGTLRAFLRYSESRTGLVNFDVFQNRPDPDAYARDNFFLEQGRVGACADGRVQLSRRGVVRARQLPLPRHPGRRGGRRRAGTDRQPYAERADPGRDASELSLAGLCAVDRSASSTRSNGRSSRWNRKPSRGARRQSEGSARRCGRTARSSACTGRSRLQLLDDTLRGVGGVRYDHYDGFGDQVTASGSGSYLIRPTQTRLRVGYAEGFRAPTFDELFGPLGNPDLRARNQLGDRRRAHARACSAAACASSRPTSTARCTT